MRSFMLWWVGTLASLLAVVRYKSGTWPYGVNLIALVMASPLLAFALWLRISKYHEHRAKAEQWGRELGERHRDRVRVWFTRK